MFVRDKLHLFTGHESLQVALAVGELPIDFGMLFKRSFARENITRKTPNINNRVIEGLEKNFGEHCGD